VDPILSDGMGIDEGKGKGFGSRGGDFPGKGNGKIISPGRDHDIRDRDLAFVFEGGGCNFHAVTSGSEMRGKAP